jgi:hypothetical protein
VPDPGAAPPPIDLCTITGYVNGLHLNCCGTMIGGCCAEDVMIPPAFIHCDGGADHGAGTWPATGYDRDTLNGDPDHDCPIFLKGSTTAPCNDPAHGGAPPDGFDAVGDCMGDIQISYINGAGNHIIPGDCNTLHFHPAGHNDSGWGGAYVNSFITPISKDQYGNWWWYDNNHFDACRSANIYGWGGNGMLTDGVTGIGTFLPVACAPNIII